jgi:hypothetical protein
MPLVFRWDPGDNSIDLLWDRVYGVRTVTTIWCCQSRSRHGTGSTGRITALCFDLPAGYWQAILTINSDEHGVRDDEGTPTERRYWLLRRVPGIDEIAR